MKFSVQVDLENKRRDKYRFSFPLKHEEVPLYTPSKVGEIDQEDVPEKESALMNCIAHHSKGIKCDGDEDFETLKKELLHFGSASTPMEYENKMEQLGYSPNFQFIEDVTLNQILSQQPNLNHLYYSFDSSAYKFLDILADELLKYHLQRASGEGFEKQETTLERKKKALNQHLQSLHLSSCSATSGQMKMEEYSANIRKQLLQRKRLWEANIEEQKAKHQAEELAKHQEEECAKQKQLSKTLKDRKKRAKRSKFKEKKATKATNNTEHDLPTEEKKRRKIGDVDSNRDSESEN